MNLQERMAALRETSNPNSYSDAPDSLPLSVYLTIYEKAHYECYINYMEGAKALHHYLTSSNRYPLLMSPSSDSIPRLLITYELNELDRIIAGSTDLTRRDIAARSIYKEVAVR